MTDALHPDASPTVHAVPNAPTARSVMQMLGRIGLSGGDGREVDELLRQPKRLALLAYLASPSPGIWHRRDTLLALFWPELDVTRSRTALRNALYVLRRHLADGTIRTRGDDDVSLDPALMATDAAGFQDACASGRHEEACTAYGGDFLPGLFVQNAEGFEKWLDDERRRLRQLAHSAALALATQRESSSDWRGAAAALTRAVELEPDDEASARRLMALYDGVGDRARALATFDALIRRLDAEFGTDPSPETVALAERIKGRRVADPLIPGVTTRASPEPLPDVVEKANGERNGIELTAPVYPDAPSGTLAARRRRWSWRLGALAALGAVVAVVIAREVRHVDAPAERALMIGPVHNMAGPASEYVAAGITTELRRRLGVVAGLRLATVRSFDAEKIADSAVLHAGRAFGGHTVLELQLTRDGDSLTVAAMATDAASGRRRDIGQVRFTVAQIPDASSRLAAIVAGTILRVPLPEIPGGHSPTADSISYRLTILGWREQQKTPANAKKLFEQAIAADPMNARAYAGLSASFSAMTLQTQIPRDEGVRSASAAAERALAIDSTQGSAWATLGIVRGLSGSVAEGEALIYKGIRMEPANAEVRLVLESLYRHTWQWDKALDAIRLASALDPLNRLYVKVEADIDLCADRAEEALTLARAGLRSALGGDELRRHEARALARLGRWDEALDSWRIAVPPSDTLLRKILAHARGADGYWSADSVDQERQLTKLLASADGSGWVSLWKVGVYEVGAGRVREGLATLERARQAGQVAILKLPCNASMDRARDDPEYKQLLARVANDRPR
ncbi:MAG: BTAD domain-containing putative transcriptional regulator [Gemmatimonadaceae bacterium]